MKYMKKITLLFFAIALFLVGYSQNETSILFTVGDDNVTVGEFKQTFNKNGDVSKATPEELREYLDLYISFKLKVKEGKAQQIDTAKAFQSEWKGYRNQSAQQYLIDKEVTDHLIQEAVDRSKLMLRAAHILIECSSSVTGKDTLVAYNRAMKIREEILNGMSFADAAVKYSQDPSARDRVNPQNGRTTRGNRGDLGYFTTFNLIYPFETGAYNLKVGEISMPVRSSFGYHLIYLKDIQPSIAKINAAQIFIEDSMAFTGKASPEIQAKINDVTMRLAKGERFEDVANALSEDKATAQRGGALEPFRPMQRPGDFVQALLALKPGEYSAPVSSNIGWHFVKLIEFTYTDTTDDVLRGMVKNRISRDSRSFKSKESLADKLLVEYGLKTKGKKAAVKFLLKNIPENYFKNPDTTKLNKLPGIEKLAPIATFADQKVDAAGFAGYLGRFQGVEMKGTLEEFIEERFQYYIFDKVLAYENSILEKKYPEFKNLVEEYFNGMLLYEINSQNIWNKSLQDSVGLEKFYEEIKTQFPDPENPGAYNPFSAVRASVVTQYQEKLEKEWIMELKKKYPVVVNEKVFESILKK